MSPLETTSRDDLHNFFAPRGIVIVGAPRTPGFGHLLPLKLKTQGWGERLSLVNPAGGTLHGMPLYKQVADVPGPVDLAIVIVPASAVPAVLKEIGDRGIRHVILQSAGFVEAGEQGQSLQAVTTEISARYGLRVIGPNCLGTINTANRFASVEIVEEAFTPGTTSIIAQSGVFANVLLDTLHEKGLFIAKAVSLGNRMDVNECEVLEYLQEDPETGVIMMYLEGAADGELLRERLAKVTLEKPVLVLKSGRTEAGRSATASHTGSLSGEDVLYEALFAQTGTIRADSLEELLATARVFASQPQPRGNRLGILTASGSLGALSADASVSAGLVLPSLSQATVDKIKQIAPAWMNVKNPLDIGPSGLVSQALSALMEDPEIDMVMVIAIIPYAVFSLARAQGAKTTDFFGDIAAIRKIAPEKPFVVCAVGHNEFINDIVEVSGPTVPVLTSPEMAAKTLGALYQYNNSREARSQKNSQEPVGIPLETEGVSRHLLNTNNYGLK